MRPASLREALEMAFCVVALLGGCLAVIIVACACLWVLA